MRTETLLKASALLAAAVVLGLLTVQGTYGLWNKVVPVEAGTIQAADFRFTLTDVTTGQAVDMTDAAGNSAVLTLRPSGVLTGQTPVVAGVRVTNATNAGSDFAARARIGVSKVLNASGLSVDYISVRAKSTAAGTTDCSGQDYSSAAGTAEATVGKNESAVFCFQFILAPGAPASVSGTAANIRVPITVDQL